MTDHAAYAVRRLALASLALLLAALACNLEMNPSEPTAPVVSTIQRLPSDTTPVLSPSAPSFIIPTTTPLATITLTPVPTIVDCDPYTFWPSYVVQQGDTLGVIASLTGTTTATLVERNCLDDPDSIYAGQLLYVPRIPPTPVPPTPQPTATETPEPNPDLPVFEYPLTVQQGQFWVREDGRAVTNRNSVTITVGQVDNADYVDFYVSTPTTRQATLIGQDTDPWNGAATTYTFPETTTAQTYTFQAKAGNQVMEINSTAFTLIHDPTISQNGQPANALTIAPNRGIDGGWIEVAAGANVTITWPNAPTNAARVIFLLIPTGTGTADLAQEIGTDLNPADGARIAWQASGSGHLVARAVMSGGAVQESQSTQFVTVQ